MFSKYQRAAASQPAAQGEQGKPFQEVLPVSTLVSGTCRRVCGEELTAHRLLCHGRTHQGGQIKQKHDSDLVAQSQELGSFLCAGGRESIHRSCDAAPSLPHPWQLQHYEEPSTSTCRCQPLPSTQRLQAGVVWAVDVAVDGLICKPKLFGAPYSSHFLPLSGCMCLAV